MYLHSLACVVPPARFRQADLWPAYEALPLSRSLRVTSNQFIQRLLLKDNGVEARHFAVGDLAHLFALDAEGLNRAFEQAAPRLATEAVEAALAQMNLDPAELDALAVCTCTGYLCPGLSSFVAERLGLRASAYLQDIVGMGCGAAIPTLRSAAGLCRLDPSARIAVVAVEVCSAAFFLEDKGDVILSACLFGDGAAAAIVSGEKPGGITAGKVWRFGDFDTEHRPDQREILRFVNDHGKLKNRLDRCVPERAGEAVLALWERFVQGAGPEAEILPHAGGRQIMAALGERLPQRDFPESAWCLRHGGNMSSPSVLFALGAYLSHHDTPVPVSLPAAWPEPPTRTASFPDRLWLTSFGAGFAAHGCSLRLADPS